MTATISDIAKKAGVSQATVSRVMNDSGYVKKDTREKVMKVMKELNYTPNAIARSLSKNKTNTIGVVVPDINNPFFGEIIKGISDIADKQDLNMILFDTDESIKKEIKALKLLKEQRIQGLIIVPTSVEDDENCEYLRIIENLGTPIVLVDGHVRHSNFNGVFVDNIKGAYEGTEALIKAGHRKIAIITGRMNSKPAKDRVRGFKKALNMYDLPFEEKYSFNGEYLLEKSYECTKEILNMEDKPTAIFASSNMMTLGCLKAIFEENLKIPEDIAFVGFDKVDVLNTLGMNISYINGPRREMGRTGMEMLLDIFKKKDSNEIKEVMLLPNLVLQGSEKLVRK